MPVEIHDAPFKRLSMAERAPWRDAEAAAVSDCLGRAMGLDGGVSPLAPDMRLLGQARTVRCTVGDNSALHAALQLAQAGDVLVADAGGYLGVAMWGGLMTEAAVRAGVAGLVVDGAVRDTQAIIDHGFPCFARGAAPTGPHKAFGGAIDAPINCGGVSVRSGDLVIGDADGVVIVPQARIASTLAALTTLKAREAAALAALNAGGTLADFYGAPDTVRI